MSGLIWTSFITKVCWIYQNQICFTVFSVFLRFFFTHFSNSFLNRKTSKFMSKYYSIFLLLIKVLWLVWVLSCVLGQFLPLGNRSLPLKKGGGYFYMFCSSLREWSASCQAMKQYISISISILFYDLCYEFTSVIHRKKKCFTSFIFRFGRC